jgi:hypothetical protein
LAITKYSEHTPDDALTEYCSTRDVEIYLAGVAQDDDGAPLQALLTRPQLTAAISKWSQVVKALIDSYCKRDFDYHEDVEIAVDGNGSDVLCLKPMGFCPLSELTSLEVNGLEMDTDNYVVYEEDAVIARATYYPLNEPVTINTFNAFAPGRQNVVATITWGYAHGSLPVKVEAAAAYWTGASLLNPADAMNDLRSPGVNPIARSVTHGDLRVDFGVSQPYARLSERLKQKAKELLAEYVVQRVYMPDPSLSGRIGAWLGYYREGGVIVR